MDSSSSSGDETNPSKAVAERVGGEEAGVDVAGAISEEETAAAEDVSTEEVATPNASSEEKVTVAEDSTDEDAVSWMNSKLQKLLLMVCLLRLPVTQNPLREVDEPVAIGDIASAVRTVETTTVNITNNDGTPQGNPSRSGSHTDPTLFDSSPSTLHYVRRAWRGSMVSTDSDRTISATARTPTPPSPFQESSGIASTPLVIPATIFATAST